MIFDLNEKTLDLLAVKSCPTDILPGDYCIPLCDDRSFVSPSIYVCRACWLMHLSKESEDNHEE